MPGFMAAINTPIVHATGYALEYGDQFSYRERLGRNDSTWLSLKGFIPWFAKVLCMTVAGAVTLPLFIPTFLVFPNTVCNALEGLNNWDPRNQRGAAFEKLFDGFKPNGLTSVKAVASSVSGKSLAEVEMESPYDAGLGFTVLCASTVSAAILDKRRNGENGKGFETAVVGVGPETLREWLQKAGVTMQSEVRVMI